MKGHFDVAIIGSGFSGSLMALICRRLGHSVVLVERGVHPRFAIGESSTPLANLLLEELAGRYHLPRLLPLTKWGTWQREYPHLACGLKRGFTFLHHQIGQRFTRTPDRTTELLVAASPHDQIADTHWYRADLDHFLVREAQSAGVEYLDHTLLEGVQFSGGRVRLTGQRNGESLVLNARFVMDATGPRGFLHRQLGLRELESPDLPLTESIYSHFSGVRRLTDLIPSMAEEDTPFPLDDAAVHHLFPGGWIWVLRFNNRLVSAGAALLPALANEIDPAEGAPAWHRLLNRLPTVRDQFEHSQSEFPFQHLPRISFRSGQIVGQQWALLPSAAGFVDPLLSTGFPLTLLGVRRLSRIMEDHWGTPGFHPALQTYASQTAAEMRVAERLIAALYSNLDDFEAFAALARIYFAAASFSETAHRLGKANLARSFLMHDVTPFGEGLRAVTARATENSGVAGRKELIDDIYRLIEPFDVAGISDRARRNWHPAKANDLLSSAAKLETTEQELEGMLLRAGFYERT